MFSQGIIFGFGLGIGAVIGAGATYGFLALIPSIL